MKTTMWTELQAGDCKVVKVDERAGIIMSVQIKHVDLKRVLWFTRSRAGNWYRRNTGGENSPYAEGCIIKGTLMIEAGTPREYPELAGVK